MNKWRLILLSTSGVLVLAAVITSKWFWRLPFIPSQFRAHFAANANILPASDDSRSQFVAINPGFRAEFGDKENPTSAYLRFEKNSTSDDTSVNADINANLLDKFTALGVLSDYQPGFSWQLFSVGIDESQWRQTVDVQTPDVTGTLAGLLGETLTATAETDVAKATAWAQDIQTTTTVERKQGFDVVTNLELADSVDLRYFVVPGKGIKSELTIGDRDDFSTACLKLLSVTGNADACRLPYNKFSFLLQLDQGQRLIHSPLSIDNSDYGVYYVVDDEDHYVARLGNFALTDGHGSSDTLKIEVRPGQVDGSEMSGFYIVTLTVNLNWLLDSNRSFPAVITSGFYVDGADFYSGELAENSYLQGS